VTAVDVIPDPKPEPRVVADRDAWEQIVLAKVGPCRGCGGHASEFHHLVPRGQRGDDVPANIAPLCRECHRTITDRLKAWEVVAAAIREGLSPLEERYVLAKKGRAWADRFYPRDEERQRLCARCRKPRVEHEHEKPRLPARPTVDWTLTVPADSEAGRDVLDSLADGLANDLGYSDQSSRLRRYHAVVRALVFANVNRSMFIAENDSRKAA